MVKTEQNEQKTINLKVVLSGKSFSYMIKRRWEKNDLAIDFICAMKKDEKSKIKLKLWMVDEKASIFINN